MLQIHCYNNITNISCRDQFFRAKEYEVDKWVISSYYMWARELGPFFWILPILLLKEYVWLKKYILYQ